MYLARRSPPPPAAGESAADGKATRSWKRIAVGPTFALLGLTSLVTDTSSEMVAAVLPLYLTVHLGFSALQFGARPTDFSSSGRPLLHSSVRLSLTGGGVTARLPALAMGRRRRREWDWLRREAGCQSLLGSTLTV